MKLLHQIHVTDLFPYPLKTSENQRLSDFSSGYKKRPIAWNGFRSSHLEACNFSKKEILVQVFSFEFREIFKNNVF